MTPGHGSPTATDWALPARQRVRLFTCPGLPLIYAGDEVAAGEPHSDPASLVWGHEAPLRDLYRLLAALREEQPALGSNRLDLMQTDASDAVLA